MRLGMFTMHMTIINQMMLCVHCVVRKANGIKRAAATVVKISCSRNFSYTIDEITVSHTIYQYENIGRHHNAHTDIYGYAVTNPDRIYPW